MVLGCACTLAARPRHRARMVVILVEGFIGLWELWLMEREEEQIQFGVITVSFLRAIGFDGLSGTLVALGRRCVRQAIDRYQGSRSQAGLFASQARLSGKILQGGVTVGVTVRFDGGNRFIRQRFDLRPRF